MLEEYEPEVWVDLKDDLLQGTGDKYQISSYGRVWNKDDECFVSPALTGKPQYYYVNLLVCGIRKLRRVHYLQAFSFYGEPPKDAAGSIKKQSCDHIDRNKYNNALFNLRWLDKRGQSANRNERTNTLKYKVKQDFNEGFNSPVYSWLSINMREKGYSYEIAKRLYEQKLRCGGELVVEIGSTLVNFNYLCYAFNKDLGICLKLYRGGHTLENIFITPKISEVCFNTSYEFGGMWYQSKTSIENNRNLSREQVEVLILCGSMEAYVKLVRRKKETAQFTEELRQEQLHGKDWGDGYFGTIRGLARKYRIDHGTIWHRVNKAGMSMKEALEAPVGNIEHYWKLNNKWYHKQTLCEKFGVKQSAVTQRMAKGDNLEYALLPLGGTRDIIFNINGNIFSKLDVSFEWSITPNRLKLKKRYTTYRELFIKLGIITKSDHFEVVCRG